MSTAVIDAGGYRPIHSRPPVRSVGTTARPKLRLTRRGRGVLLTLTAVPIVIAALLLSLNGGGATASLDGASIEFQYVTVDTGQTLWGVAETIAPTSDPRDVIDAIVRFNHLVSADVYAGQELAIPVEYLP